MAKAASGSSSEHTTAPDQPSSGSSLVAISGVVAAFHGYPAMSSAWDSAGGAGSGWTRRGSTAAQRAGR
jgi:uncharacterized Zn-binding protein involved in type VI secretion